MRQLIQRLRYWAGRKRAERELAEEIELHRAMRQEELERSGMPDKEAAQASRRAMGNVTAAREDARAIWIWPWLEGLFSDLRFALRGLRRDRAFALAAIAMLALAVGLNATMFTVMNTMLFRGFALVQENDSLVYIQEHGPSGCCMSYPDFEVWRSQAQAFDGLAFVAERPVTFSDGGERSIRIVPFTVSANTFELLGVQPTLGRDFVPADEGPGTAPVAILNYRFWESRFGKRADIIGSTVYFDGAPATVIGVMPEGFDFPTQTEIWMPLAHTPELHQRSGLATFEDPGGYLTVARLRGGADIEEARAELETINRSLEAEYPETNRDVVPTVKTHSQFFVGQDAPMIYGLLWAAGWFILLIACANLANRVLARTVGRWREFSTRIALGAGSGRMIRRILVESLTIAIVAGALGWWIVNWGVRTWAAATASPYQILDYTVDSGTLAYLVAISVAAAIVFSLAPIGRVLRLGVNGPLRGGARGVTRDPRGKRLAAVTVATQMALAIVLLSGAGVLVRSLFNIVSAETGVRDPENIVVGTLRLPPDRYPSPESRLAYFDRLEAQLTGIPGIDAGAVAVSLPVGPHYPQAIEIEGRSNPPDGSEPVGVLAVGPDYFRVVGAFAISGRDFSTGDDRPEGLPAAIVNQRFATDFWPGEKAIGKRLRAEDGEWRIVVGVVPNIMQGDPLRQRFYPLIYVPFRREPPPYPRPASFLVRTGVPPDQVMQVVRAELEQLDSGVTLQDLATLKASFAFNRDRMPLAHAELGKNAAVAPIFAAIALLLAAIGLYAVIAHSINQRTKEIGVRMAIGAATQDIRRMVLGEGMLPVAIGAILGLAASLAVNRVLQSQLVGVSPNDPVTMAGAPAILILVALLACQIPARRAMKVDPTVVLRND